MNNTSVKRSYVRKNEVKPRLVVAAFELLHEQDPNDITIRDIARRAGSHHRYIPDYFGGKFELLIEVLPLARIDLQKKLQELDIESFPSPELVRFIKLLGWLMMNDEQGDRAPFTGQLFGVVSRIYQNVYSFDAEMSDLLAKRLIASVFTMVLMPQAMWLQDGDAKALFELEKKMMTALAVDTQAEESG